MLKYILKRLGISVIILLGVSVIIYSLVRMMPNDYIEIKYASQLQSGTITQDDIDRFKELYGLAMPEAYLDVEIDTGADGVEGKFTKKVRIDNYETALLNAQAFDEFVAGDYSYKDWTLRLTNAVKSAQIIDNNSKEVVFSGAYSAEINTETGEITVTVTSSGVAVSKDSGYKVASGWQKFGAIMSGYFTWIGNLLRGNLGYSFKYNLPVAEVIGKNMWISFAVALVATILQFLIAIPLGISSATHQYSVRDYLVTVFTMIGISLPTYFFAAIAIKIFSVDLGLFPANGLIYAGKDYPATFAGFFVKFGDILHHMFLPILVNVLLSIGGLMRYTRTNTLEVLSSDYIRTARAKGLSEKTVIYKHAFRNTLIPLATLLAGILPSLFGGMMITEQVFGIDGIGRLAYQALREGDVPFVMGYNMFLAVLTVIGTLMSDIMYSIVDPRVKLGD